MGVAFKQLQLRRWSAPLSSKPLRAARTSFRHRERKAYQGSLQIPNGGSHREWEGPREKAPLPLYVSSGQWDFLPDLAPL